MRGTIRMREVRSRLSVNHDIIFVLVNGYRTVLIIARNAATMVPIGLQTVNRSTSQGRPRPVLSEEEFSEQFSRGGTRQGDNHQKC
jgi:hypothetical protein